MADLPLLRIVACGSVDDGKSSLIGRLLHDSDALAADQVETLAAESRTVGTQGGELDYALLLDGLSAEREQGITIDIAHRQFASARRRFLIADAPGHEQYTHNLTTAASTADLAILLIDVRRGVRPQTARHAYLAHLLGVRSFILAVNKMDLAGYDQARFDAVTNEFRTVADRIGIADFTAIPLSALRGDNVTTRSDAMPWYDGPTLIERLESAPIAEDQHGSRALRMPVQWITRAPDFRGVAGTIAAGTVRPGDAVLVLPSGVAATVERIVTMDGDRDRASAGQAVTLVLAQDVDCARGDVIVAADAPPGIADQFEATILWFADDTLLPGRSYLLKLATQTVAATLQPPKYAVEVETMARLAARTLARNAIGVATLETQRPIVFEPYAANRTLGGFLLIDRESEATVGAGLLHFGLRRAQNVVRQPQTIGRAARAALKSQRPAILWFTGLSGAGKSTIANLVDEMLAAAGRHTFILDGDNLRGGLNRDLGYTDADRIENMRRVGQVARLMTDAGLIVIVALISPFRAEREMVREMMAPGEFVEIHVDVPLATAEARDPKGLYAKARRGELANFTGIDSPYEPPVDPDMTIDTTTMDAADAARAIVERLLRP